jgi:predicted metalloprotease with PDZ domain
MPAVRAFLLAIAALLTIAAGPAPELVRYRLTPALTGEQLAALQVEIRLEGDADGETVLDLPGKGADGTERWRLVSDLAVEGAQARPDGDTRLVLDHAPGTPLVVRYRVRSAYGPQPPDENSPFKGPMLRPEWFMTPGFIFATPQGRESGPAAFAGGPLPEGWKAASNLDHGAAGQAMTVQNVFDGVLIGGRGLTLIRRPIPGASLRVAVLPADWRVPPAEIANTLARVIVAQRRFWGDLKTPFFVAVTPMAPAGVRGSVGGFGRWQGFALFASTNSMRQVFEGNIGHEHTHAWIPQRVGVPPNGRAQIGQFWFSEGFTDFFGDRTLLRTGVWSTGAYVASVNRALHRYANPATRNATNAEILQRAFSDTAYTLAPYDRGRLLAMLWDRQLMRATRGRKNLDDVLVAMRERYLAAPPDSRPGTVENLVATYREVSGGIDLTSDVERYVVRGETIVLPHLLYAPCRFVTVTRDGRTYQRLEPGGAGFRACEARLTGSSFTRP